MDAAPAARFRLGWRAKALAFSLLDAMPFGELLYRQLQRHVTKTVPRQLFPTSETVEWYLEGVRGVRTHYHDDLSEARLFEFGAGWDLYSNFVLWCYGVEHQTVCDLRRLVTPDQVNHVIRHLQADPPPGAGRVPSRVLSQADDFVERLSEFYGIRYRAPMDAAHTGLTSGSIDVVLTTSVLEHIPFAQLRPILRECHRLMRVGAVMSHIIDYSDHYAHSDSTITPYNFLRFEDSEWARFNTDLHHQNRGRHADYRSLFEEAGFRILEEWTEQPPDALDQLASVPRAGRFRDMPAAELAPTIGCFILGKAPG